MQTELPVRWQARAKPSAQIELVLHTAGSYVPSEGAGIGIVQQARCPVTGIRRQGKFPRQKIGRGLGRKGIEEVKITSYEAAHFHAVTRALEFALQTIKAMAEGTVTSVLVCCGLEKVANLFKEHIVEPEKSLSSVQSVHIRKIVSRARKIMRREIGRTPKITKGYATNDLAR
ncbi:hypothetical protein LTR37_002240 [Vermiconidia calcicola]|uniref:Uncharacterized protein n=1 Tax=Vermiconidia calcicola TaxID=1690605 RepID=A0ACC3NT43_9PEZI|nr:hypothetical protein LTR37_002240 [Vermiconidia calcicola]